MACHSDISRTTTRAYSIPTWNFDLLSMQHKKFIPTGKIKNSYTGENRHVNTICLDPSCNACWNINFMMPICENQMTTLPEYKLVPNPTLPSQFNGYWCKAKHMQHAIVESNWHHQCTCVKVHFSYSLLFSGADDLWFRSGFWCLY